MQLKPNTTLWRTLGLPPMFHPLWEDLNRLVTHSWFKRAWIVQEHCLGNNVMVTYGTFHSPVNSVIQCFEHFYKQGLLHVLIRTAPDESTQTLLASMPPFFQFLSACRKRTQEDSLPQLHELITRHPQLGATNPRDRIYALLGLSSDADASELKPDYNLDTEEVFIRTCSYILQRYKSLHFLYDCSLQTNKDLPSWIPDWATERRASSLTREINLPNGLVPGIYDATNGTDIIGEVDPANQRLKTRGCIIDEVVETTADLVANMSQADVTYILNP